MISRKSQPVVRLGRHVHLKEENTRGLRSFQPTNGHDFIIAACFAMCIYTHIHTHTHTYIYTHTYTYMNIYILIYMYIYIYIYLFIYIYIYTHRDDYECRATGCTVRTPSVGGGYPLESTS